ncbi:MAG: ATP-grasp domain-containing protein [Alphaproteobacteria bacterium]|nr:ATP-grasp domain-containing protein [Alphaproteobacteria bacterium]
MTAMMTPPPIHVIHENPEWLPPFARAFAARSEAFVDWDLSEGAIDLSAPPPEGLFYNRMSASAHSRGHRYSPEFANAVIAWLAAHGRPVINGPGAIALEVNKAAQMAWLKRAGVPVPRTVAALGDDKVAEAAMRFAPGPVIVKPNRGGKGLGIQLFENAADAAERARAGTLPGSTDGITLLQEYIATVDGSVTRAEFIGGKLFYAVRIDTGGTFELCPADVCAPEEAAATGGPVFTVVDDAVEPELEAAIEAFLRDAGIDIAGVEFARDAWGNPFVYDVNTNTNYNPDAEAAAGVSAPQALVDYLIRERNRRLAAPRLVGNGWGLVPDQWATGGD